MKSMRKEKCPGPPFDRRGVVGRRDACRGAVNRLHRLASDARGFNLAELLVLVSIVGILASAGAPAFIRYWRTSTLKAGAQQLATILNEARVVAISRNTTVCVTQQGSGVQLLLSSCTGTAWTGPGTDSTGLFALPSSINVSAASRNLSFDYLGGADALTTYTVQNPIDNSTLTVTVALSGRVTIP